MRRTIEGVEEGARAGGVVRSKGLPSGVGGGGGGAGASSVSNWPLSSGFGILGGGGRVC